MMENLGSRAGASGDLGEALPKRCEYPDSKHRNRFIVGGVSVEISGDRSADAMLVPPLALFWRESRAADVSVRVEWVAKLTEMPGRRLFDSGSTWRLYEDGAAGFQFDFSTPILGKQTYKRMLVDAQFHRATVKMNEECFAGTVYLEAPLAYPLDELLIMHRLTQERAIELHGSGIVRANGVGNLFVGHSGAGKSTTTRLWTSREEVEVLSDDRIIVRQDEVRQDEVRQDDVRYGDGRARPAGPVSPTGMRMYGTPWHGEAMFASPNSAPLSRIFVLEHGQGNVITRLS